MMKNIALTIIGAIPADKIVIEKKSTIIGAESISLSSMAAIRK